MKFGETLYQRSVPQWAAYNVNYNEIKRLIKERTSTGLAVPVSIPSGSSQNRWEALEDELYNILKDQHDNISLFLKSKYGEIDRRLNYLEKQVRSSLKSAQLSHARSNLQDRKYRKLLEDAESIGQDIQNLTRFAGVQKTAIRKILKKYRKWTGSLSLQTRLENEVFSAGQLNLDYAHPLDRLAAQTRIVKEELQGLRVDDQSNGLPQGRIYSPVNASTSTVSEIKLAEDKGPLALDAALATIPFGKSSGSATYWIHPDNLDEAQALMLRHVREIYNPGIVRASNVSANSKDSNSTTASSAVDGNYIAYFDNPQRFAQDAAAANRPSKVALSGRWCQDTDGIVTLSNLAPWNPAGTILKIKRKEMFKALNRDTADSQRGRKQSPGSDNVRRVQEYLAQHRDVKPQSQIHSMRSRYVGTTNSARVGVWATLDSDIIISPVFNEHSNSVDENVESGEAFPHAVLEVRWEFCHTPELVRAFDTTHLAERVKGFTLESAGICAINKQLQSPPWKSLLEKDIRKVPITTKLSSVRGGSASRMRVPVVGSSSGPSSTDGPTESIFSAQNVQSSATSIASPDETSGDMKLDASPLLSTGPEKKKKRARIDAQSPPPRVSRYWNEFDDGDEDVNPNEAYTIYVDPNESFPGAETVAKAFGSMYRSLQNTSSRVSSMLSLKSQLSPNRKNITSERSPLIDPSGSNYEDGTSSDSDNSPNEGPRISFGTLPKAKKHSRGPSTASNSLYRPNPILTPRQQALERAYLLSSAGLAILSYVILFICGVLVSTGRKRAIIEIDIAMIAGIATAETCAVISMVLLLMRKTSLSVVQWTLVALVVAGVLGLGVAEIVAVVKKPRS